MAKEGKTAIVPKLRFPEFLDSPAWCVKPLSAFISALDAGVSVNAGDRPAAPTEIGVLKTSCVTNGVFDLSENKVVLDTEEQTRVTECVLGGTIIISRMNTPALVGANAYVESGATNIFLPDRLWAAKPAPDANMRFVAYILGADRGRGALSELAAGSSGSMKNIAKSAVLELLVSAPEPNEQQKIADCLSSLDELIAAQGRKVGSLKTYKRGLMQQLFPREGEPLPRLRFPEFRDAPEWISPELGSMTSKVGSGITPLGGDKNYKAQGRPFVRSQNIGWGELLLSDVAYIDEETHRSFDATEIQGSDVLLNITGASIGRSAVADSRIVGGNVNQHVCIIRVKADELNPIFLSHFLISERGQNQIDGFQAGGNRQGLNFAQIRTFEIPTPPTVHEQHRVAECLSSLDAQIAVQSKKLEALKAHKSGLMQQLFPSLEEE